MESDFWQRRLATVTGQPDRAAAITAEIAAVGAYAQRLAEALEDEDRPGPAPTEPLAVTVTVLGVAPCAAGWVGALLEPTAPRPRVLVASTLGGLVEMVREQVTPDVVSGPAHPEMSTLRGQHRGLVTREATGSPFASLDELTAAGMLAPSVLRGAGYEAAEVLAACAAAAEALV